MTSTIRTAKRSSYPALLLFFVAYLAILGVVVAPEGFFQVTHIPVQ